MSTEVEEVRKDLYVTVAGQTHEFTFSDLGLTASASDEEIKQRLYEHFDGMQRFADHRVTREPTGKISVAPNPIYG